MEAARQTDDLRFGVLSANTQEALRELSESTGGFIIANTNNTDQLLARVMEDVDTYYELSYRPASESNDGHFRKIEVKLAQQHPSRAGHEAIDFCVVSHFEHVVNRKLWRTHFACRVRTLANTKLAKKTQAFTRV